MKIIDIWVSIYILPVKSFQKLIEENYLYAALASLITVGLTFGFFLSTSIFCGFFPSVIVFSILLFAFLSLFTSVCYFLFSILFGSKAKFLKLYQVCSLSYLPLLPMLTLLAPFLWKYIFDITTIIYPVSFVFFGVIWCCGLSILGVRELTKINTVNAFIIIFLSGLALIIISFVGLTIVICKMI